MPRLGANADAQDEVGGLGWLGSEANDADEGSLRNDGISGVWKFESRGDLLRKSTSASPESARHTPVRGASPTCHPEDKKTISEVNGDCNQSSGEQREIERLMLRVMLQDSAWLDEHQQLTISRARALRRNSIENITILDGVDEDDAEATPAVLQMPDDSAKGRISTEKDLIQHIGSTVFLERSHDESISSATSEDSEIAAGEFLRGSKSCASAATVRMFVQSANADCGEPEPQSLSRQMLLPPPSPNSGILWSYAAGELGEDRLANAQDRNLSEWSDGVELPPGVERKRRLSNMSCQSNVSLVSDWGRTKSDWSDLSAASTFMRTRSTVSGTESLGFSRTRSVTYFHDESHSFSRTSSSAQMSNHAFSRTPSSAPCPDFSQGFSRASSACMHVFSGEQPTSNPAMPPPPPPSSTNWITNKSGGRLSPAGRAWSTSRSPQPRHMSPMGVGRSPARMMHARAHGAAAGAGEGATSPAHRRQDTSPFTVEFKRTQSTQCVPPPDDDAMELQRREHSKWRRKSEGPSFLSVIGRTLSDVREDVNLKSFDSESSEIMRRSSSGSHMDDAFARVSSSGSRGGGAPVYQFGAETPRSSRKSSPSRLEAQADTGMAGTSEGSRTSSSSSSAMALGTPPSPRGGFGLLVVSAESRVVA